MFLIRKSRKVNMTKDRCKICQYFLATKGKYKQRGSCTHLHGPEEPVCSTFKCKYFVVDRTLMLNALK